KSACPCDGNGYRIGLMPGVLQEDDPEGPPPTDPRPPHAPAPVPPNALIEGNAWRRNLNIGSTGRGQNEREYRLLSPIARGGMGELFLAEMIEPGRPPRRVVIKRLLDELSQDAAYVAMFRFEG